MRAGELGDRVRLAEEVTGSLTRIRATAENWRTGMAGLLALVTATLVFKGKDSITAYGMPVRVALGVLTGLALIAGVVSLLKFLRTAHGVPEVVGTDSVIAEGGVNIINNLIAANSAFSGGGVAWGQQNVGRIAGWRSNYVYCPRNSCCPGWWEPAARSFRYPSCPGAMCASTRRWRPPRGSAPSRSSRRPRGATSGGCR